MALRSLLPLLFGNVSELPDLLVHLLHKEAFYTADRLLFNGLDNHQNSSHFVAPVSAEASSLCFFGSPPTLSYLDPFVVSTRARLLNASALEGHGSNIHVRADKKQYQLPN